MTEERIWELVERLGTLVRAERRRAAGALGLQPVHLQVLEYLSRCNRYSNTPQAVAAYLGTTKGTISQSLAVLERGGWIRKRSDPADGRVVRLEVTARARRAMERLDREWRWKGPGRSGARARQRVAAMLAELLRSWQAANRYRTFGVCQTCRHLLREGPGQFRCGLTREALARDETEQICHEHEYPSGAPL
jgi:DNA-binding MarR family transcriptional regulator